MYNPNFRKKKRVFILFILVTTISLLTFSQIIWNTNNFLPSSESDSDFKLLNQLKASDYSSDFSSSGENMNITLHESYLNNSFDTDLALSDPNNNSFTLPSPTDVFFNSSFTEASIEDIYASNKTLIVEDDSLGIGFENFIITNYYASFTPKGVGYIENISLLIKLFDIGDPTNLTIRLYDSENDGGNIRPLNNLGTIVGVSNVTSDTYYWHKITDIHTLFNSSETYNDTFFFRVGTIGGSVYWDWSNDVGSDGVDEMIALNVAESPLQFSGNNIDLPLKIDFAPLNNTPKPSEIALEINNTAISDVSGNTGYWSNENQGYSDLDGDLSFEITAEWWDVTCKVSQAQINYTKTDLRASTEFDIAGSGQAVEWNITRNGGLNYFDSRFDDYQINFTIPEAWDNPSIRVFNGESDERTLTITKRLLGNDYREINVPNAGNGTFWFLNATSTNLASSIDSYNGLSPADTFNFTDFAHFNATFSKEIGDGIINLSVYSPAIINDELNYSVQIQSFTTGSEINLTKLKDWDISNNVSQYGKFRVHVYWSNNTEAGFLEEIITILGETSLTPDLPVSTFDASDIFDIDIFFNDTGLDDGISGASITHSLDGGTTKTSFTDFSNGTYRISIDCNDTDFSAYGSNLIEINASISNYNNQSETVEIIILGETSLNGSTPKTSFNSTETFNVSMFYNDTVKNLGIDTASIDIYVNLSVYNPIINDHLNGSYDITINCSDNVFDDLDYGSINISVDFEKSYYYNQTDFFIINITGETNLTATKFPDPIIGYYNSDETFNITVYFEDIGRKEGINGGQAKIYVKEVSASIYQEYIATPYAFGVGYYNFTVNCSDSEFNNYGKYDIKINITKTNYYMADTILGEVVIGNTTLTILDPTGTLDYDEDEVFDIVIEYKDYTKNEGINESIISYTLNGTGFRSDNYVDNSDGTYDITINVYDSDFGANFGNVSIIIWANKTDYINLTRTLTFERRILTNITPTNVPSLIEEVKGNSIFFTFNYSDNLGNPIDNYDDFENITSLQNFNWTILNEGGGNYTIEFNTTQVLVIPTPYTINFSIYAFGNQSQEISLTILITIIQTRIEIDSWNNYADFARSTVMNISIDFYFNDTTNIDDIEGLSDSNIIVKNFNTDTIWVPGFELFDRAGPGNYTLNISTIGIDSGFYTLELNISKFPNYNWSLAQIQFSLRGNNTQIYLISVSDPGGQLAPQGVYNFTIFEGSDIDIEFNMTDLEFNNTLVSTLADSYTVRYLNLNTIANGILASSFQIAVLNHGGSITTSNPLLGIGNFEINITISKLNYEEVSFVLNLTIIQKYQANLTTIKPEIVDAGLPFNIIIKAEYYNGSVWLPIENSFITIIPYYNGIAGTSLGPYLTNSTGEIEVQIPTYSDTSALNLTIQLTSAYYHQDHSIEVSDIKINPIQPGFSFEDLIPYLIIIGAAVVLLGGSIGTYRVVIVPRKREKSRILKEVKTIFDDAINLEHILVLYKGTGTCVYFKSFGSEEIDPELISGFISAICSFGKDLVCQEELNEINYGDKMLLLSDGEYIRVALVLSKKPSVILRKNLMGFITIFEKTYSNDLPNWRGQLNLFRNSGLLIDEKLSTSIILPHEISYEFSNAKDLKNTHSRDVLKIANNLMKTSERKFFFIATLLKEATEKTKKDTAEIFMGIKELRDKKIMIPIEISAIEVQPISQQEMALINQKVAGLVNLSQEERQKIVNDLAQMGPAEREAYFVSLGEQEIVSAPIEEKPGTAVIDNKKVAKKEIKNLHKIAKIAKKEKDYDKAINIFQNAAKLAITWELIRESEEFEELIRLTKIEDFKIKMTILEKEAKLAAKEEKYNEASQKYKMSSKIASEIFKLGGTEMTKEVKRLSNKSKEYEKLI